MKLSLLLIVMFLVSFLISQAILGFHRVVTLDPAPALVGIISQDTANSSKTQAPLVGSKDFTLTNVTYFNNKGWVVATLVHTKQKSSGLVVLHKIDGTYQTVLGPGTAFPSGYLQSLPPAVGQYLSNEGVFYES